jgi:2-desacetyl-2-hydroxyethyl bacteriochlorophyllide A dehydrogenase
MRALYTPAPGVYHLAERPRPEPTTTEAVVKVARSAVCHTDVIIRSGRAGHVNYPVIPGHEFSGVVDEVGPAVEHLKPGDRVAVRTILSCGVCPTCRRGDTNGCERYDELGSKRDGGFAEYCAVPAQHLFPLPDHITLEEAALVEPLANAVCAVRQARVDVGDRVVIIGPGPIGLLALQVARLCHPSELVLVGTRDTRLELGRRLGATHAVNTTHPNGLEAVRDLLGPRGANVVLECAGTTSAFRLATELVAWHGRVAVEGVYDPDDVVQVSPWKLLLMRTASILGIAGWTFADFSRALELLSMGLVDVRSLITHIVPLESWEQAFELVTRRKDEAVKVELAC